MIANRCSNRAYFMFAVTLMVSSVALSGCQKAAAGWQVGVIDNKMEGTQTEIARRLDDIEGGGQIQTSITCENAKLNFEFLYDSGVSNEANPVGMMWQDYLGGEGVPVRVRIDNGDVANVRGRSENMNVANIYFLSEIGHLTNVFDTLLSMAPVRIFAESSTFLVELPLSDGRKPVIEIKRDDEGLQTFFADCTQHGFKEFVYNSKHKAPLCREGEVLYADVNMAAYDTEGINERRGDGFFDGGEKITVKGPNSDVEKAICKATIEGYERPVLVSRLDLLTADEWKQVPHSAEIDKKRQADEAMRNAARKPIFDIDPNKLVEQMNQYYQKTCNDASAKQEDRDFACQQVKEAPLLAVCQDGMAEFAKRKKACDELDKMRNK